MNQIGEFFNIILPLLIFFQWHSNRAREDTIRNSLFGIRRMIERMKNSEPVMINKASDLIDSLDGTLATLGVRAPFADKAREVIRKIKKVNIEDAAKEPEIV